MNEFWFYFKLGLHHVLDINAYDHILFFIALTVPFAFKDWRKVLWMVTLFTVGHTVSLILSVYGVISVNTTWVEFLIPCTIFITALFNVFTAGKAGKNEKKGLLFFAALFFGLIHGLGFSHYFIQIIAGTNSKLIPLLEFALGIEASQAIIVLIVLILGFIFQTIFRFNRRDWVMVISSVVIGVVIPMLIGRYPY
ncbi:HupE/UreJ family protein [Zhouia sp. PK063]|uniref:HupE/UreJ family protein n=1 Tax=Zhouia sp. PK063 TaxID=3373602 RepID=UPI003794E4C6